MGFANQSNKESALFQCLYNKDWSGAMSWIANGAQILVKDSNGNTPLHWAAWNNRVELVNVMVIVADTVNQLNYKGESPLHWALWGSALSAAQVLLNNRANPQARDNKGWTPILIVGELENRARQLRVAVQSALNNPPLPPGVNPFGPPPQPSNPYGPPPAQNNLFNPPPAQ